ncbi:MAG: site-specific DNA-methyltransferase [Euryarchaeota archaeon]|nr:site-specific DNA-methyltransferase [Euryarchaeota archaeon]
MLRFGDSRDMSALASDSVQLVATSPPYPYIEMWDAQMENMLGLAPGAIGEKPGHFDAAHRLLGEVWRECLRVLTPGGILAVNIGDATRTVAGEFRCFQNHARVIEECESMGFHSLVPILWKKPTNKPNSFLGSGFYPTNCYVTLDCEYILLFRKGGKRAFAPKDPLRLASQFSKPERDAWFSQVWAIKGARQEGMAVFPEEIPERLVRMFSVLGDAVLDPFAGSGSTLAVARRLGRKAIGYEVNEALRATIEGKVPLGAPDPGDVLDELLSSYGRPEGSSSPNASA